MTHPSKDIETIPSHILKDEILYKKYIKENMDLQDQDSSSRDSSPERKKDPKQGSFSSLMNILNTMKKASMQKNAIDSRQALENLSRQSQKTKISSSAQDLTNIPGSCQNIKGLFENMQDEEEDEYVLKRGIKKSPSCIQLDSIWTKHVNSNSSSQYQTDTFDRSSIKSGLVSNLKQNLNSDLNSYQQSEAGIDRSTIKSGLVSNLREYLTTDSYREYQNEALDRSSIKSGLVTNLREHITSNSYGQHQSEALDRSSIKSGLVSNLREHLTTSDTNEKVYALNDPVKRRSLSHLDLLDEVRMHSALSGL